MRRAVTIFAAAVIVLTVCAPLAALHDGDGHAGCGCPPKACVCDHGSRPAAGSHCHTDPLPVLEVRSCGGPAQHDPGTVPVLAKGELPEPVALAAPRVPRAVPAPAAAPPADGFPSLDSPPPER